MPSNEGKMEKSFLHFKASHPDWQPTDPASSVFLSRLADLDMAASMHPNIRPGERRSFNRSTAVDTLPKPRLETMRETEPEWDASGLGTAPANGDASTDSSERDPDESAIDEEEGPEGFLRDAGVMGLLQQVLNR
jgi:autophagy-related protein 9